MFCFSLEAIDITAALARCAMSRMEEPEPLAVLASAGLASVSLGGVARATLVAGAEIFGFAASAGFGAWVAFASGRCEASATRVASTGRDSTDLGSSPCGADAANR